MSLTPPSPAPEETYSTMQAARMLGMAVRSVQLMVDRGELQAWKTPGGHRRIAAQSLHACLAGRGLAPAASMPQVAVAERATPPTSAMALAAPPRLLLIEDSAHFQGLVRLLVQRHFPTAELHVAADGIAGLALCGQLKPHVLLVDLLLPGIDGATLITSLRSQPAFAGTRLVVVTSLNEAERAPYAFALQGLPVIHKPRLALDLPACLAEALEAS